MKKFDRKRLILGIVTGLLVLLGMLDQFFIRKDYWGTPYWMFASWIGFMYNMIRWTESFLSKNPERHWRQVPRFLENEPILNALALNCYKWFGLILLHIGFIIAFTYPIRN